MSCRLWDKKCLQFREEDQARDRVGSPQYRLVCKTVYLDMRFWGIDVFQLLSFILGWLVLPAGPGPPLNFILTPLATYPSQQLQSPLTFLPTVCIPTAFLLCLPGECSSFFKNPCTSFFSVASSWKNECFFSHYYNRTSTVCIDTLGQIASHYNVIPVLLISILEDYPMCFLHGNFF